MQRDHHTAQSLESNRLHPHTWVLKHADYLYAYVATRLHDNDQARDLVQETFLAALERMDKFEGRSSERTWLTSILKHKIIDVYRSKSSIQLQGTDEITAGQAHQDFFDRDDGHWNDRHRPAVLGIEQTDALENKEFQRILLACMKKLPALWLSVFTMKHMDDEATGTICKELKVTPSNFWVIIHRTKVNLRSCLQKNWI